MREPTAGPNGDGMTRPPARHFLRVTDLTKGEISQLLIRASQLKTASTKPLEGKTLGLIFEKASTRTRISFEVAMSQLGGHSLFLSTDELQLGRGEPLADTARVLSCYLDGLVIRTFQQSTLDDWAAHATIPVINGLTDRHHPCQALSDLLTIVTVFSNRQGERIGLDCVAQLKLGYIGDGNNVAHSLIEMAVRSGLSITLACPNGHEPNKSLVEEARREASATGAKIELTTEPSVAARESHILYTDVWTSMGQEEQARSRRKLFRDYQLNASLLALARPDAIVMHCLPAHRGEEITDEVMDSPQSVIWQQAENRLHMQKALLEWLL